MEMTQEAKDRLKNTPRRQCYICKSKKSYGNPVIKCDQCGKFACFDHIHANQIKKGMDNNERLRDVCPNCKKKYEYGTL